MQQLTNHNYLTHHYTKDILFQGQWSHMNQNYCSKYFFLLSTIIYLILFPIVTTFFYRLLQIWSKLKFTHSYCKHGSFSECQICCFKGVCLLFLPSQYIQLSAVCIISTFLCVLRNESVCSLLWWGSDRKFVFLLASAEVVLMSPGTDTAGSGRGPITTPSRAHYFYMMIMEQIDRLKKNTSSISSAVESNLYST